MDYSIKINEFEGPMDLLLHLVSSSNIDINDISIEEITKQYMDYINKMEELNINVASSYLVMAAQLMEIKSKSLLPQAENDSNDDDFEDEVLTREKLIKKLVDYQKYKEVTSEFRNLELDRRNIHTKSPSKLDDIVNSKIVNDSSIGTQDLIDAFSMFLQRKDMEKPLNTKITSKEYSVKKRKNDIKNILSSKGKVSFVSLFDNYEKIYIVVTFLSILELSREGEIVINQDNNFDDIYLELKVL